MEKNELIKELLSELSYRSKEGYPKLDNREQISILAEILDEWGYTEIKNELIENLLEADDETFTATKKDTKQTVAFDSEAARDAAIEKGTHTKKEDSEEDDSKEKKKDMFSSDTGFEAPDIKKPAKKTAKLSRKEKKEIATKTYKESETRAKEIYGDDLNTPTLQKSVTSDEIINKGYEKDKYYTAPGNAGSAFNELLSNEIAIVLSKNPNLSEDELTSVLYHRFGNTKLAKQQSTSTKVESPIKKQTGVVPDGVEPHIWKSCIIAARSGKAKSDRATKGTKVAQKQVGFGSDTTTLTFGGTSRNEGKTGKENSKTPDDVITDLEALENEIEKSKNVYVYDDELGEMIKIPKDVIKEWVASSGGGENAADTVVLTKDENGNVIFDGWSDKKGLNDLQGNSTLNDDYTKQTTNVDTLVESGQIDTSTSETAKQIISDSKKKSKEIEDSYSDAPKKEAEYFRTLSGAQKEQVVQLLKDQEAKYIDKGTTNHVQNAMNYFKVDTHEELLDKLTDRNEKTSVDRLKIITRAADGVRKNLKSKGEEIPPGLDTKQILSDTRKRALDLQRETVDKLNEHSGKTKSGKTKRLGDMLGFQETIDFLHIDKIEKPKSETDYKSALKRNTQLVMGGVPLKPKDLKDCLGVENLTDYEDNFEVITEEKFIMNRDKESGKSYITGKTVLIYAINKGENKKTFVGEKSYRSKEGKTGKTGNTIKWSKEMQSCFDSK